ncbi:MAG TPA: diguanylate cyclase [Acidobacteriaceae bacterium]|jgi:diguanylate cyclase (GGDEF)-like protein|nr:diguanylate cyclase [Acidobacteriaceae bacterium]
MPETEKPSVDSRTSIALILIAAIGAVLFTIGAGLFLFRSTNNLVTAGQWVEHTQEVMLSIQSANLMAARIQPGMASYKPAEDEDKLDSMWRYAIQLQTTEVHLKMLVSDNPRQTPNIEVLESCSTGLVNDLKAVPFDKPLANGELLRCQQALALMAEQERELLKMRDSASLQRSRSSFLAEAVLVAVCLSILVVLFGFLLRDAILRNSIAREAILTNQTLSESVKSLQEYAEQARLLTIARDELQLCLNVEQVYRSAATRFSRLLDGTNGSLCIINSSRNMVEAVSSWQNDPVAPGISEIFTLDACCGLRSGQVRWRCPGTSEIDCNHFAGEPPSCYLCVPLIAHSEALGILFVDCPSEGVRKAVEIRMEGLRQLVQLTAMALASLELQTKLERQSIRDGLTGLFNRHFMQIALEREVARAVRRKSLLAVFMVDIDHFKKFNDQSGHSAGDTVLKEVARVLAAAVRTEDLVCRYGGEEFTIILPDVTPEAAYEKAEALRRAVSELRTVLDNNLQNEITISIGVASFPKDGQIPESLLKQADAALYRAKHEGRNRVVIA